MLVPQAIHEILLIWIFVNAFPYLLVHQNFTHSSKLRSNAATTLKLCSPESELIYSFLYIAKTLIYFEDSFYCGKKHITYIYPLNNFKNVIVLLTVVIVVQRSLEHFNFAWLNFYTHWTTPPLPLFLLLGDHHYTFCFYEFDYFR